MAIPPPMAPAGSDVLAEGQLGTVGRRSRSYAWPPKNYIGYNDPFVVKQREHGVQVCLFGLGVSFSRGGGGKIVCLGFKSKNICWNIVSIVEARFQPAGEARWDRKKNLRGHLKRLVCEASKWAGAHQNKIKSIPSRKYTGRTL